MTRRVDIFAGASLAWRTVSLPLSIVKIRLWLPRRFVVAGFRGGLEKMLSTTGDRGFESVSLQRRVSCEPRSREKLGRRCHDGAMMWISAVSLGFATAGEFSRR